MLSRRLRDIGRLRGWFPRIAVPVGAGLVVIGSLVIVPAAAGGTQRQAERHGIGRRDAPPGTSTASKANSAASPAPSAVPRPVESGTGQTPTVQRYAPFVYLAPGERFEPLKATSFVAESSLSWARDQGCSDDTVADRTHIDQKLLGSGGYRHQIANALCVNHGTQHPSDKLTRPRHDGKDGVPKGEGFFLNFPNERRAGQVSDAPVYYEYAPRRYITYWFFYAFNDAPKPTNAFDHEGDWERISIRLDSEERAVTVAYFEHSGYCTRSWSRAGKHDGHPLAYSARGTHATYPRAGTFPIAHGLATDTAGRGTGWATYRRLANARDQGWFGYGGAWGEVGEGSDSTGPLGPSPAKSAAPTDWSRPCS